MTQMAISRFAEQPTVPSGPVRKACPACGDEHHLYGRADVRWDPAAAEWVVGDMEDEIDCTTCDWLGPERELINPSDNLTPSTEETTHG